jgi:hypothetical protein
MRRNEVHAVHGVALFVYHARERVFCHVGASTRGLAGGNKYRNSVNCVKSVNPIPGQCSILKPLRLEPGAYPFAPCWSRQYVGHGQRVVEFYGR